MTTVFILPSEARKRWVPILTIAAVRSTEPTRTLRIPYPASRFCTSGPCRPLFVHEWIIVISHPRAIGQRSLVSIVLQHCVGLGDTKQEVTKATLGVHLHSCPDRPDQEPYTGNSVNQTTAAGHPFDGLCTGYAIVRLEQRFNNGIEDR